MKRLPPKKTDRLRDIPEDIVSAAQYSRIDDDTCVQKFFYRPAVQVSLNWPYNQHSSPMVQTFFIAIQLEVSLITQISPNIIVQLKPFKIKMYVKKVHIYYENYTCNKQVGSRQSMSIVLQLQLHTRSRSTLLCLFYILKYY